MHTPSLKQAAAALAAALALASCGGSGSDAPPPAEPDPGVPQAAFRLQLLAGSTAVDFDHCESVDGEAGAARFSHLLRATVYADAVYLAETGEACRNVRYGSDDLVPENVRPAIRRLSGTAASTAQSFVNRVTFGGVHPVMVRYPSGFHRSADGQTSFVLGYAAARSERGFALDENEVARYTAQGGWHYYVPGFFRFAQDHASYDDLIAGRPGEPPAHADGPGQAAAFVAPHDLEVDAAGLFYLIDDGRIRTIDRDHVVTTLDHAALGITGTVKALDADHQGRIHVLTKHEGNYTWHRLADGTRTVFQTRAVAFGIGIMTWDTFTVVGNDIVLGSRSLGGGVNSDLFRVTAAGQVTPLTGEAAPTDPAQFLQNPEQHQLPAVQHIEYGVDGHLYLVLPQGVLVARDYS
ncbi:MAG: hypothetical protein Q4G71_11245 [Pseudomonadota bacterium]|nr:hypothetical protein [Pseudomonadota bacterium]